jgi:hypothetical protein
MKNKSRLEGDVMNQQPLDSGVGTSEVTQWSEAKLANDEPRCRRTTLLPPVLTVTATCLVCVIRNCQPAVGSNNLQQESIA